LENTIAESGSSTKELLFELFRIRQLIGFNPRKEALGYIPLFLLITALSLFLLILFFRGRIKGEIKYRELLNARNIWLPISSLFLILYFFAPDHISAGNMTNRFGIYFFFLLIVWLSNKQFPKFLQSILVIIVFFSIVNARIVQHSTYRNRSNEIAELKELTEHMIPNSIVDYRLSSKNWMHTHIQLYAVLDKPFVHLRNVQCWGQFPMIWKYSTLPRCFAGEQQVKPSGSLTVDESHSAIQIEYFTVFKYDDFWQDASNSEWHFILRNYYNEIYISKGNKCALYQIRKND
jgi:hypothetical protein